MSNDSLIDPLALTWDEYDQLMVMYFWVQGVFYCIVCFTGGFANIFNIIALSKSLKSTTYKIFLAMACSDLMVMLTTLGYSIAFCVYVPPKLYLGEPPNLEPGVTYNLYLWMNLWFHISNLFICASNWCTVLVAVFRLIVVSYPLKATVYASSRRVTVAILLVYHLSFIAQIPGWIPYRFDKHGAVFQKPKLYPYTTVAVVTSGPVPMLICTVCTFAIILQLAINQARMKSSLGRDRLAARWKGQKALTITLILVLLFFILTNLPATIYWIMEQNRYFITNEIRTFHKNVFYLISTACGVVGYAGNFFIYIFANSSFRNNLKSVFCSKVLQTSPRVSSVGVRTSRVSVPTISGCSVPQADSTL